MFYIIYVINKQIDMKQNFTNKEISTLVATFGSKLQISINRAGNIKLVSHNEPVYEYYWDDEKGPVRELVQNSINVVRGFWVLYHNNYGYLWRRINGTGYSYPLNMKRGPVNGWGTASYNIENSYFNTFEEAVEYFKNYLEKYRGIKF